MSRPRLFIASSSEGLHEARALLASLQARLGDRAEVRLWTSEFGLSSTDIEALEQQARETDFAVAVFSPDDRITSRARRQQAPRDNVIFELGLFIGALGRPPCFLVHRKDVDLTLPSDLLAVVSADFVQTPGQALADALAPRSEQIAQRVRELGAMRRTSPAAMVRREQSLWMAARLRGDWWARMPERLRVVDRWTGTHPNAPQAQFHGIAAVEFDPPATPEAPARRGHGRFWEVDEARPENTHSKAVELQREDDAAVVAQMLDGRAADRQALSTRILAAW